MAALPIGELLRFHADRKSSEAIGLHVLGAERVDLSWGELDRRSNRRAAQLGAAGVTTDDFVMVALPNGIKLFETTFAIWKAGATPLMVSRQSPAAELRAIIDIARPKAIVSDLRIAADQITILNVDEPIDGYPAHAVQTIQPARHWKAITSGGSTGRPKVIVDHKPATFDPGEAFMGQPPGGVVLNPGPLYHNGPFLFSHSALFAGAQLVCMERFDPEEFLRVVQRYRVQWTAVVPTMMHRIMALPESVRCKYDLSSLQRVLHFAAPISRPLKEAWLEWLGADRTVELYAATEAVGVTMISGSEWLAKRGSVGRPVMGSRIRIVDDDGFDVPAGTIGEVYMTGPAGPRNSYHYLGAERRVDPNGWESVGDLGWLDSDGYLFLADRRTDVILRGGANIYAAEVEGALEQFDGVRGAVVIGLPDPDLGQRVHAILETGRDSRPVADQLTEHLQAIIAKYKVPESYEFVDVPLRDDAGKVRRSKIRDERVTSLAAGDWLPPIQIRPFGASTRPSAKPSEVRP